jgi:hypothetical protein
MAGHGGRREGAGRPKGSRNKRQVLDPERQAIRESGEVLPLEFLLKAMRDVTRPIELRLFAARVAAPYLHAKVSSGPPRASWELSDYELDQLLAREEEHDLRQHPGRPDLRVIAHKA